MRYLYILFGTFCLVMGIIGIFLPVLPTTPLLLLTAWCYYRGSDRLYEWLMEHPYLGTHIKRFREQRIIPRKAKAYILTPIWLKCLMMAIAIGVTWHILSYRSE